MNTDTMNRAVNYATWLNDHTEAIETLARIGFLQNGVTWMRNNDIVTLFIQVREDETYTVKGFTLNGEVHDLTDQNVVVALTENHPDFNKETSVSSFSMAATADQITSWQEQSIVDSERQKHLQSIANRLLDALAEIERDQKKK